MKKGTVVLLVLLILIGANVFAAFDEESFAAWSESIRKFSGLQNIQGKLEIEANLLESGDRPYELFYALKFYSRDLRDFRIDFDSPRMLEGISLLYQYREQLLYVLNIEKKEYAMQSFEAGEEIQFNPTSLLMEFLDFLLAIDSIPLLNVHPKKTESGHYFFRIQFSAEDMLSLFDKEYPSITIYLNDNNEIREILLLNKQTEEKLNIKLIDVMINVSSERIDRFFNIPINQYNLIEYIGSE